MPPKQRRGMDAILADAQAELAAEPPARPARAASPATDASPASPRSTARLIPVADEQPGQDAASPAKPARTRKTAGPGSSARLRSWYMTSATADMLAEAVTDLHFRTRAPKWAVLEAIVRAGVGDLDSIAAALEASREDWQS